MDSSPSRWPPVASAAVSTVRWANMYVKSTPAIAVMARRVGIGPDHVTLDGRQRGTRPCGVKRIPRHRFHTKHPGNAASRRYDQ